MATQAKKQPVQPSKQGQTPASQPKSPLIPITSPGDHAESSRKKKSILERLGPVPDVRGKAPIHERLGPMKKPRTTQHTGGRHHLQHDKELKAAARTNLRIEVQEHAENSRPKRHVLRRVTFESPKKASHPQMETLSSDSDSVIPEKACLHTIGYSDCQNDELYYRAGGTNRTRKRSPREREI